MADTLDKEYERRKEALQYAWNYFSLHSGQRMTMFNYYIAVFALVCAGIAGSSQVRSLQLVGLLLGVTLPLISLAFWKLDQRTSFLIKHAERALEALEAKQFDEPAHLFHSEAGARLENHLSSTSMLGHWTYRQSFNFMFALGALFGVGSAATLAVMVWG